MNDGSHDDPESEENLREIQPARRYTLEEVRAFYDAMSGIVVSGRVVVNKSGIRSRTLWYTFDVIYDDGTEYTYADKDILVEGGNDEELCKPF